MGLRPTGDMNKNRKIIYIGYFYIDMFLMAISFYMPYCLKYNNSLIPQTLPYFKEAVFLFVAWGAILVIFLQTKHLYSTDRSLTIPRETGRVFFCVTVSSILAGAIIFIFQIKLFSRLVFLETFLCLFFSLSFWRLIKRVLIRYRLSRGFYNINVLIVGAGEAGLTLAQEFKRKQHLGRKIAGFFDTHQTGKVGEYNILSGNIEELKSLVQKNFISEIYLTAPVPRHLVLQIISIGKITNTSVNILLDNYDMVFSQIEPSYIGFHTFLKYTDTLPHKTDLLVKRVIDIVVSMVGLVVLSPVFALISILIKLEGPGPVFYRSPRCGRKGKIFNFYKFRSMICDADKQKESLHDKSEVSGPVFKIKSDPRVTFFGKFIRRYSLDELPQLFNVLRGDMSIVGPRPPTPDEVAKYDIWQMRRLDIRPGITCLWQVRGRSDLSFYKWVKWDLWYIDHWSLGLDIQILLWTIPAVLKGKGAY
jgi:exopolysaccharide biosynthesis polyprenyl glycosylphosphotransferase